MGSIKLLSLPESKELDQQTIKRGYASSFDLMDKAGMEICKKLIQVINIHTLSRNIIMFAGKGNNGGDIYASAYYLKKAGYEPVIFSLSDKSDLKEPALSHYKKTDRIKIPTFFSLDLNSLQTRISSCKNSLIVEGLLGTGFTPPLQKKYLDIIKLINKTKLFKVSIDIPSGLIINPSLKNNSIIEADITLTIGSVKKEMIQKQTINYCGRIYPLDIGFPDTLINKFNCNETVFTSDLIISTLKKRKRNAHKGHFGHALLIGGSYGMTGSIILSAKGAIRSGIGLLTISSPTTTSRNIFHTSLNEIMTIDFTELTKPKNLKEFQNCTEKYKSICLGPGLGCDKNSQQIVKQILKLNKKPIILDADALNIISQIKKLKNSSCKTIMTPHPKEAARLLNATVQEIEENRIKKAKEIARQFNVIVVLKGANTVVSDGKKSFIHLSGTPAQSSAGMGDVLSGIITSFIAQNYPAIDACNLAVSLMGFACEKLENMFGPFGFKASEVADIIPLTTKDILKENSSSLLL